jgi:hypothetical protein
MTTNKRTPSVSWETEGLRSRLVAGSPNAKLVAEIEPTADRERWIWSIRPFKARRSTGEMARSWQGLASLTVAMLAAEDALREIALGVVAKLGVAPAGSTLADVARIAMDVGGQPMRSGETGAMIIGLPCGQPGGAS